MTVQGNDHLAEVYDTFSKHAKEVDPGRWQGVELDKKIKMWETLNTTIYTEMPETEKMLTMITLADQPWSELHFEERMAGKPVNPGESYKQWPWNKFDGDIEIDPYLKHGDGKFSHTYMERYWGRVDQPNVIVNELKKNRGTRQAYFPVWWDADDEFNRAEGSRVPCSLGYLFLIRENKLHITYYIRSCDLLRHFRNDVYLTIRLAQWVRDRVDKKIKMGQLTMHVGSLHLFHTDKYALEKREDRKFDGLTISK